MTIRSADVLSNMLMSDPQKIDQIKNDPKNELPKLANEAKIQTPLETDKFIYRTVVISLGGAVLIVIIGMIFLSLMGKTFPDSLTAIGSAAVGAIAGLLAPSPAKTT